MDNQSYKKILKLIIIANIVYFSLNNLNEILKIVKFITGLFIPFIIGICMAFILNIPMKFFEKQIQKFSKKEKSARMLAIFTTIFIFIIVINLIISMIIPEVIGSINELRINLPSVFKNIQGFFENSDNNTINIISKIGLDFRSITDTISGIIKDSSFLNAGNALQSIFSVTSSIFSTVMNTFLGAIFAIYILSQKEILIKQLKSLILAIFGKDKSEEIIDFFNIVSNSFSKFIEGQGKESTILGFLFLVSMTILGLPKAVPISAIIGVCSIIPLIGVMIAFIYAILSILIISPIKALWFSILFLILQQIEGNLIYPRVVGKSVGLPGILVLLSITVSGGLAGFLGMIVAVPTMSIIYTILTRFVKNKTGEDWNELNN